MSHNTPSQFDFIIPFRSKSTTKDWKTVCSLLEQTVASACHSMDSNFRVIIVCHEIPDIEYDTSKCEFLQVNFEAPKSETKDWPKKDRFTRWSEDKGRKCLSGIQKSRSENSRYFMILDADDFVSNRLVEYCLSTNSENGYYFDKGYRTDPASPSWVFSRNNYFKECGSSFILRTEKAPFPKKLDLTLGFENYYIRRYTTHSYIPECMEKVDAPLEKIPFAAGIYRFHYENIYAVENRSKDSWLRKKARKLFKGKRINAELIDEFQVPKNL